MWLSLWGVNYCSAVPVILNCVCKQHLDKDIHIRGRRERERERERDRERGRGIGRETDRDREGEGNQLLWRFARFYNP